MILVVTEMCNVAYNVIFVLWYVGYYQHCSANCLVNKTGRKCLVKKIIYYGYFFLQTTMIPPFFLVHRDEMFKLFQAL